MVYPLVTDGCRYDRSDREKEEMAIAFTLGAVAM